jgi:hypothetical protein
VERERRLAGALRPVDLDDAPARQAADAQRYVEAERAGGDDLDLGPLAAVAEPHDRALAERALDLRDRRVQRPLPVVAVAPADLGVGHILSR